MAAEDEEEDEGGRGVDGRKEEQDEEEEVRVSIGLDPTLDREEEEDRYDRAAFGREDAAERVYMSEIMDAGINMSINTVVPDLLDDAVDEICGFSKDPRADLGAASARLREHNGSVKGGPHSPTRTKECPTVETQSIKNQDISVKPILKRKEEHGDSKPRKRVRFNADVKDQAVELSEHEDSHMVPQSMDVVTTKDNSTPSGSPGVPDYIRNPSKYTCYTLDTPESTDESNRRALADLHNMLGRSDPNKLQPETPFEIPSSVMFIPRKKSVDAMVVDEGPKSSDANSSLVSPAAISSDGTDQCEMDEDDPEASPPPPIQTNSKMNSRRYRSSRADDD